MVIADAEDFPVLDALVVVHYDGDEEDFYRTQIRGRIETYLAEGKKVYNLSTLMAPPEHVESGVYHIRSKTGEEEKHYHLVDQVETLVDMLEAKFADPETTNLEVVGFAWWICVEGTKEMLAELGYSVQINYACTDLVGDYLAVQQIVSGDAIFNDRPMPEPSALLISRYKEAHSEV